KRRAVLLRSTVSVISRRAGQRTVRDLIRNKRQRFTSPIYAGNLAPPTLDVVQKIPCTRCTAGRGGRRNKNRAVRAAPRSITFLTVRWHRPTTLAGPTTMARLATLARPTTSNFRVLFREFRGSILCPRSRIPSASPRLGGSIF